MLLQSHGSVIHLLPALPDDWPSGSIKEIKALHGFEVDITWSSAAVTEAVIFSHNGSTCSIRGKYEVFNQADEPIKCRQENNITSFNTLAGKMYKIFLPSSIQ